MASVGLGSLTERGFGSVQLIPEAVRGRRAGFVCASASGSNNLSSPSIITVPPRTDPDGSLPIQRDIPGDYGLPFVGSVQDRLSYFWYEGSRKFYKSRIDKYRSTVFRVNMPPGSPFFPDPRVIMLLDQRSFPVLFDVSKVSKRDVFTGTFRPSTDFNGGYRILSYLDVDEPRHAQLKGFCMDMLKSRASAFLPQLHAACSRYFDAWEAELAAAGQAEVNATLSLLTLSFLSKSFLGHDATLAAPEGLGEQGPEMINKWTGFQIAPVLNALLGLPPPLEELLFHTFPLPYALAKPSYERLVAYFARHATPLLDMAERQHGVPRDEALHNLIFIVCFNTFGGLVRLLPSALHAARGETLALRTEVRAAVAEFGGGAVTIKAVERMPLLLSFVLELLRYAPPVPLQYGRAREDMVVSSHREGFRVKKGEMLCGFQPIVTRDPEVFQRPNEFIATRFMGDEGERLVKHVLWSNGPETDSPSPDNKQCAGKNFIVLIIRAFLAEFFLRYDSFQMDGPLPAGPAQLFFLKSLSRSSSLQQPQA